jgi:hypothetical protein
VITWIVGAGGLLGRSLVRHSADSYHPGPVPWHDPKAARETLHAQARTFEAIAGTSPWRVIWAAGAATTSTPHDIFSNLKRKLNTQIYKENPEVFTLVRYGKGEAYPPSIWGYEIEVSGQKVEQY